MTLSVGFDVGQLSDPSALAVVRSNASSRLFVLRLERFPLKLPYPDQSQLLALRLRNLRIWASANGYTARSPIEVFIDVTGVGRSTFDLLREAVTDPHTRIIAVTLTAGAEVRRERHELHLPKMELVDRLRRVMEERRLEVPPDSREFRALTSELRNFLGRKESASSISTGARAGAHDDLVVSLGLAVWGADATAAATPTTVRIADMATGAARPLPGTIYPRREGDPTLVPIRRAYDGTIFADEHGQLVHRPNR